MADTKNTGLGELAAVPADDDLLYMVDISDTSMAPTGTSKKNKAKYILRTNGTANTLGANINANGFTFNGAGTVGIATASPISTLQVERGAGTSTAFFVGTNTGSHFNFSSTEDTYIRGGKTGASVFINDSHAGTVSLAAGGGPTIFGGRIGEAWTGVSFNTGWGQFSVGYPAVGYKKVGDFVFLRGVAVRSSGSSGTIFTLPSGYRPATYHLFPAVSNNAYAQIDIDSSGNVVIAVGSPTDWVSLNGIAFSTL